MRIYAAIYFAFQGIAGAGWWILMVLVPAVQGHFLPDELTGALYSALLVTDTTVFVMGSLVASAAIWTKTPWHVPIVWMVSGGTVYATLFTVAACALTGVGTIGAGLMTVATVFCLFFAWRLWRVGP